MQNLFDDYHIQISDDFNEFKDFFLKHKDLVFKDEMFFNPEDVMTQSEVTKISQLEKNLGEPYRLRVFILYKEEKIGWFFGSQTSEDTFYMTNTAILPHYQNKGVYKSLLSKVLEILEEKGFQKVYSRHVATNNQVIIPKLKQGFLITNFEISDMFGVLIHLTYFFNKTRRRVMNYRVGYAKTDEEIKRLLL